MGIFTRFFNLFRANVNAAMDRVEDPTKMLEQSLLDMSAAQNKVKDTVASAVADEKRLEATLRNERKETDRWNGRAIKAVEKGDDDLAREALTRKAEHTIRATQYEHEVAIHTKNVDDLKNGLNMLRDRINEIKRKKNLLISKQKRAESQDAIYATLEGVNNAGALDMVAAMEEKIDSMAALADARLEMSDEFSGNQLERKFAALDNSTLNVDSDLLELKKQLKLEGPIPAR